MRFLFSMGLGINSTLGFICGTDSLLPAPSEARKEQADVRWIIVSWISWPLLSITLWSLKTSFKLLVTSPKLSLSSTGVMVSEGYFYWKRLRSWSRRVRMLHSWWRAQCLEFFPWSDSWMLIVLPLGHGNRSWLSLKSWCYLGRAQVSPRNAISRHIVNVGPPWWPKLWHHPYWRSYFLSWRLGLPDSYRIFIMKASVLSAVYVTLTYLKLLRLLGTVETPTF